ncbi:MAG TPA: zf-HC2 domain-containing protein [Pyrinomonadaceae bacterium]|nr:zf-HC2 domain-containing protein [Pyrinomonadaceae bacterium]
MNCEETTPLLSQFIDDVLTLPVRANVDEHLDRCPVCRDHAAELRSLSRSLRQLSRPVAPRELAATINDALMIEAAARRQSPERSWREQVSLWLEPRLMPYSVGSLASVVLFASMFVALSPHFMALQLASRQLSTVLVFHSSPGFDLNQPVSSEDFSNRRAPFAEQSPSLNPGGALAALTSSYANPRDLRQEADDMVVVADVFSNGSASLADVVHAPRDRQMLADFEVALRQSAAFVPASLDRRPDTMRVVFTVQKVDVRDRSF